MTLIGQLLVTVHIHMHVNLSDEKILNNNNLVVAALPFYTEKLLFLIRFLSQSFNRRKPQIILPNG